MTDPVVRSSDDPPPVDAYGRGRRWLLVTCGGLLALALLVVAFNLDGPDDPVRPSDDGSPVAEIKPPSIADAASGGFSNVREGDFVLERGGWVQIADAQGRLVQEYTATRLEPKPGGEIELINPSGRFYLSNNRILVVSGDQATARRRDNRMLESGRISGNVRIALYEGTRDTLPDPRTMAPSVYVTTSEAVFDNLRGEIRCDADLHVQTTSMEFFGRGLLADYDKVYGLRRLTIDEATRPIRIAGAALAKATSGSTEAAPSTDGASTLRHAPDLTGPHAAPGGVSGRGLELPPFVASVRPQSAPPRPGPDASAAERRDWLRARREMAERRAREASRQAEPDRFYRATFERDVHLWRGVEADPDQFITGDVLRLVFSMDNSELRESSVVAAGRSRSGGAWIPSIRPRDVVATLVLAAAQDPVDPSRVAPAPGPDDVYLSYAGRLIVLPVEPGEVHLASKDDVHAELVGSPVTLVDRAKEATATCGRIEYITAGERLALLGTDEHTLTLDSSEISLKGTRFDYSVRDSRGELVGPGMMHLAEGVARIEGQAAEAGAIDPNAPARPEAPALDGGLDIEWSSGVELVFLDSPNAGAGQGGGSGGRGRLEKAIFRGDVIVNEERFNMQSDLLEVHFDTEQPRVADAAQGERSEAIREIVAAGAVIARGLDERGGLLGTDHLRILFAPDPDDPKHERKPREMFATGRSMVRDATQEVKASNLYVLLEPAPPKPVGEGAAPTPDRSTQFSDRRIRTFRAEEKVEIVMDNGARASGDLLVADAIAEVADLTGREVVVTGSEEGVNFTASGTHAKVTRERGRATVTLVGAGKANILNPGRKDAKESPAEGAAPPAPPVDPPAAPSDAPPGGNEGLESLSLDARTIDLEWTDRLTFTEGAAAGSGMLDVRGSVKARSETPLERNFIDALVLTMEFEEEAIPGAPPGEGGKPATRRVLRRFTAKGDAKLETHLWDEPGYTGPQRIHYIAGQHVDYHQRTLEATVLGAGELLIHDPRPETSDAGAERGVTEAGPVPMMGMTGRGTTLFQWQGGMVMKQQVDERYQIVMQRDVTMQRKGLDHSTMTLSTAKLDVAVKRRPGAERQPGLDFGGSTDVEKFEARGAVLFSGLGRRVDCDALTYTKATEIAEIAGTPTRDAEISTERSPIPTRARRFRWDMLADRVQILEPSTTVPRGG